MDDDESKERIRGIYIRSLVSIAVATAIDGACFPTPKGYVLGPLADRILDHMRLGIAVGAGVFFGGVASFKIPSVVNLDQTVNGTSIAQRSFEVMFGTAVSYLDIYHTERTLAQRFGIVVVTDVISSLITNAIIGKPISPFVN